MSCHDDVLAGHLGTRRTLRRTLASWPAGLMEFIKVDEPFEKIGLDVLGPFPESDAGNRNVFVAIDYLTKWAEPRASPTQTAEDATAFLLQCIIVRHGAPRSLVTDQGKCFVAKKFQSVTEALSIRHRTTVPYRAQSNGMVEHLNAGLAVMLSMYVEENQSDWDVALPMVTFAYNTSH